MKRDIAILGSTGSIGSMLVKIIAKDKKSFNVVLLTCDKNYKLIFKQAKLLNVKNLVITNKFFFEKAKLINNSKINIFNNYNSFKKIFQKKLDYSMSAISGINGLKPTLGLIKYSKVIAIANKESIICGWELIRRKLKRYRTKFIPVDSEHFSIWFGLNKNLSSIDKIYLTASGGPFLNLPLNRFNKIKLKEALRHPNWKMGKKISIDSATMMNKVFEVIEAKNIFNLNYNKLNILIHPKSYVHAIIKFHNGMVKLIVHDTNMEYPIFNTLYFDKFKKKIFSKNLNINLLNNLKFTKIDYKRFPIVKILKKMPNEYSLFETILVSANDTLVYLYLKNKIKFNDISKKLFKIIDLNEFKKYKKIKPKSVKEIIRLSQYVRLKITTKSV